MKYYVKGTVREDSCNKNSAITHLVLEQVYGNFGIHDVGSLKGLADQGLLWVRIPGWYNEAKVRIYYSSFYRRYIATTSADNTQCNNLLALPIYYPTAHGPTTTNYGVCSL